MEVSSLWACMLTLKIQAFYSDLECGNFRVYAHVLETSWSHHKSNAYNFICLFEIWVRICKKPLTGTSDGSDKSVLRYHSSVTIFL